MVQVGFDTGKVLFHNGKVCTSCCNVGDSCIYCSGITPKKICAVVTGMVDCICMIDPAGDDFRVQGYGADEGMLADHINDIVVECTQVTDCTWQGHYDYDGSGMHEWHIYDTECDLYTPANHPSMSLRINITRMSVDRLRALLWHTNAIGDYYVAQFSIYNCEGDETCVDCSDTVVRELNDCEFADTDGLCEGGTIAIWTCEPCVGRDAWASAEEYVISDKVLSGGDCYICYVAHTSASADEPEVGANWEDYWKLLDYECGF